MMRSYWFEFLEHSAEVSIEIRPLAIEQQLTLHESFNGRFRDE
jgi:hypothetical protein